MLEQRLAQEVERTSYLEKTLAEKSAMLAEESVKTEYLKELLDEEAARFRQLEESTANQLIAQRDSVEGRVRERDERIAGLEVENEQMRSRCALLDSFIGQLAAAGLVPQATSTDAAADADLSAEKDTRIAEGQAQVAERDERIVEGQARIAEEQARVAELERLLAKSRREHNQMQARALKAEMRNPRPGLERSWR